MTRAVFLDRDGVIIRTDVRDGKPFAITSLDELVILDGAADAIQRLKDARSLPDAVDLVLAQENPSKVGP